MKRLNELDIAINFPCNLLVSSISVCYPLLGKSERETQAVLRGREISCGLKQLIEETLLAPMLTLETCFSYRRAELLNQCLMPLFTSLKKVRLGLYNYITDSSLEKWTTIEELCLSFNQNITDKSLQQLTNLRVLDLQRCDGVTGSSFQYLTGLKKLNLEKNEKVVSSNLLFLSGLEDLNLSGCDRVEEPHLLNILQSLRVLKLQDNHCIDAIVAQMTRLEKLCYTGRRVQDGVLSQLPNLKALKLFDCRSSDSILLTLTSLTSISLQYNNSITTNSLSPFLHSLKSINIRANKVIDRSILFHCPNLEVVFCDTEDEESEIAERLREKGVRFVWRKRDL